MADSNYGSSIDRIAANGLLLNQQLGQLINTLTTILPFSGSSGTVTLAAAASTTVSNSSVKASSRIDLTAANAAAGTLVGSAKSPYAASADFVVGTSFTIKTASGGAAAGTEVFYYTIINQTG